ncbi:MAG: hypothetical protein LBJ41_07830 [Treponema sp.]|jgi:hypothetical protein|nr:hypothetical protein [Treponema sp.]
MNEVYNKNITGIEAAPELPQRESIDHIKIDSKEEFPHHGQSNVDKLLEVVRLINRRESLGFSGY